MIPINQTGFRGMSFTGFLPAAEVVAMIFIPNPGVSWSNLTNAHLLSNGLVQPPTRYDCISRDVPLFITRSGANLILEIFHTPAIQIITWICSQPRWLEKVTQTYSDPNGGPWWWFTIKTYKQLHWTNPRYVFAGAPKQKQNELQMLRCFLGCQWCLSQLRKAFKQNLILDL